MLRVLATVPLAFLVGCECTRDLRIAPRESGARASVALAPELSAEPSEPAESAALPPPRWTLVPVAGSERPDLMLVDWAQEQPSAVRVPWQSARDRVLEGGSHVGDSPSPAGDLLEWGVPADLDACAEELLLAFLDGCRLDVTARYGRIPERVSLVRGDGDLARLRVAHGFGLEEARRMVTR